MRILPITLIILALLICACRSSTESPTLEETELPTPEETELLTLEEEEAKEVVTSYLNAWENENYDAMRSHLYLESFGGATWSMEDFRVPVRNWQIEKVQAKGGEITVRYTIEAPDLGCIAGAYCRDNPRDKARLLTIEGTFITWQDTLRLVKEHDVYKIRSNSETSQASNRLATFINSLGISVWILHSMEDIHGRFASAIATYGVEFHISTEQMEEMLPEISEQLEEYTRRLL
jgi:hypothetical protein